MDIIQKLIIHNVIDWRKIALDQLANGYEILGFRNEMKQHVDHFEELFVVKEKLTATNVLNTLGFQDKATCPSFLLTFLQIFGFAFEIYFPILPDLVWFNLCEDVYFAFFALVQFISYTFHFGWKFLRYATLLASTLSCWVFVNILKTNKYVTFAIVCKVKPQAFFQKKLSLLYVNKMPPFILRCEVFVETQDFWPPENLFQLEVIISFMYIPCVSYIFRKIKL